MQAEAESFPLLTGPEEAALYHHAGDRGFFTLLWVDPEHEARAKRVAAERRQLQTGTGRPTGNATDAL
ncbi:MAG: hypothetical protein IPL59_20490 [Candidatus Competibacteraceae bacterium]|nr:hypothetical protein [Candidatus Competibacteraceae bacterium]